MKGNVEATRDILLKLRAGDSELVQAELEELADEMQRANQEAAITWSDMFRKVSLRRALIVTIGIQL